MTDADIDRSGPTAAVLVIGDEILSGRTQDTNLRDIAKYLAVHGVDLAEARTVPDVNDEIVAAFLEKHPDFSLLPASAVLGKQGIACEGDVLRLLPHKHNTDGFFAAAMERKA